MVAHMIIKQAYISRGLRRLASRFMEKYSLSKYCYKWQPLVIFGMYYNEDYSTLMKHRGDVTVVWCGSDALRINGLRRIKLKERPARHIAISEALSKDLTTAGIPHKLIPISACTLDYENCKRGESIYFYGNHEIYGIKYLPEIRKLGFDVIQTTGSYSQSQIKELYRKSFVGVRLTQHDGLPNTVLELAMMGRRSIYNGEIPHSVKWTSIDDVCESIISEYERRHEDNAHISKDVKEYINIGNDWLEV